jgi:hypothetical protein
MIYWGKKNTFSSASKGLGNVAGSHTFICVRGANHFSEPGLTAWDVIAGVRLGVFAVLVTPVRLGKPIQTLRGILIEQAVFHCDSKNGVIFFSGFINRNAKDVLS